MEPRLNAANVSLSLPLYVATPLLFPLRFRVGTKKNIKIYRRLNRATVGWIRDSDKNSIIEAQEPAGCKSAANAARRPSHRRPKPGTGANQRHAMPRGGYHDVGGYQFRGGNTPASAMHWVKGWPVAVKMGFAVGSAKVVVPLPP